MPLVVAGVVPWIVVFVSFVLVVLESMVAEPLTELESLPEDPMSSELVLHPATKPANANAAKNCFIISLCLCFQPVCALNLPQWARNANGGDASDNREVNPTRGATGPCGALGTARPTYGSCLLELKAFDSPWPSVMFCPPVVWRS